MSRLRKILMVLLFLYSIGHFTNGFGQENRSGINQRLDSDPQTTAIREQIQQVKRRLSILGPKHPAWGATKSKLDELEARLSELLKVRNATEELKPEATETPKANDSLKADDANLLKSKKSDSGRSGLSAEFDLIDYWRYQTVAHSTASPYQGYTRTPPIVHHADGCSGRWRRRFPGALTQGVVRIGEIPHFNKVWGVEYDSMGDVSRIWEWEDSSEAVQRGILWSTVGEVLDVVRVKKSDTETSFYVLLRKRSHPYPVELIEVVFGGSSNPSGEARGNLIATMYPDFPNDFPNGSGKKQEFIFSEAPEGVVCVSSSRGFTSDIGTGLGRSTQIDPLTLLFWGPDQLPDLRETRRNWVTLSKIIDTDGQSISLLADGLFSNMPNNSGGRTQKAPPKLLSETGIFVETDKLQPRDYFKEYYIENGSSGHGENDRSFIAIPVDSTITYSGRQGWCFPDGTIFLQLPSIEEMWHFNSTVTDRFVRLFVKSRQQWYSYVYRWYPEKQDGELVDELDNRLIKTSCISCHSIHRNDGIIGFDSDSLAWATPEGSLQLEYLKNVGFFETQIKKLSLYREDNTTSSQEVLKNIVAVVWRIQNLSPSWVELEWERYQGFKSQDKETQLAVVALLIDAWEITGKEVYRELLIDQCLTLGAMDKDGVLNPITQVELYHNDYKQKLLQSRMLLNVLTSSIALVPSEGKTSVLRSVAGFYLSFGDALAIPTGKSATLNKGSIGIPGFWGDDSKLALLEVLAEYYGITGSGWALSDMKSLLQGSPTNPDAGIGVGDDLVKALRLCLINLRAWELSGDGFFLQNAIGTWRIAVSAHEGKVASDEEVCLFACCVLRFLALDVDGSISESSLNYLIAFERLVKADNRTVVYDSQSPELGLSTSVAIASSLTESQRVIVPLLVIRQDMVKQ